MLLANQLADQITKLVRARPEQKWLVMDIIKHAACTVVSVGYIHFDGGKTVPDGKGGYKRDLPVDHLFITTRPFRDDLVIEVKLWTDEKSSKVCVVPFNRLDELLSWIPVQDIPFPFSSLEITPIRVLL